MKSEMKPIAAVLLTVLLAASGLATAQSNGDRKAAGVAKHHDHASALGKPGEAKKVGRTVNITMSDSMRFSPASVSAKKGETIRFVLKNEGKLKHEMVLGTITELKEHALVLQHESNRLALLGRDTGRAEARDGAGHDRGAEGACRADGQDE